MSRPDPKLAAWRGWALAAALAGSALARFAGGSRTLTVGPSGSLAIAYQGRAYELPAGRPRLQRAMQAAGALPGARSSCLRLQDGALDPSGPAVCVSHAARFALGLPLDLNRATLPELERLPGLGRKWAQAILEERARRGGFQSLEECLDLAAVPAGARPGLARELVVEASFGSNADPARKNQ